LAVGCGAIVTGLFNKEATLTKGLPECKHYTPSIVWLVQRVCASYDTPWPVYVYSLD